MDLATIDTPFLALERGILERNILGLHSRLRDLGVNLRPHGKTAKNGAILDLALQGQAGGIAVSTLREAEHYFEHGIEDITYAVGISPAKLSRVMGLSRAGARMSVILDTVAQVEFVAERARSDGLTLPVLIELDCDGHRSGVTSDDPLLLEIGRLVHGTEGVTLQGVLTHAGESYSSRSAEELRKHAEAERDVAAGCAESLRRAGLPCPTVSVGSTPTATFARDLTGVTEVRAGVFMFYDLVMAGLGVCRLEDIAISVVTSVIGHQPRKGWTITDAGWMALSADRGTAAQAVDHGYGLVCDLDGRPFGDRIVSGTNQEHGIVRDRSGAVLSQEQLEIGTRLRILPNHACATAAMHDRYHIVDDSRTIIDVWERFRGW